MGELSKLFAEGMRRITRQGARDVERQAIADAAAPSVEQEAAKVLGRDTFKRTAPKAAEAAAKTLDKSADQALADLPEIAAQIKQAKVGLKADGTLVKALPKPSAEKPVTFVSYKALDNELSENAPKHLNVLEKTGSSTNANVLVFSDGAAKGDTHAYYVVRDAKDARVTSPYVPVGPQGELDTGSADALKQAVALAKQDYPSKLLWVDDNDHGAGWHGINQDAASGTYMKLPAYAQAIKDGNGGKPVDLLTHDACLMASAESAYELKDSARIIVASEDETFPLGMNYDQTLASVAKDPTTDPVELARRVIKNAKMTGPDQALDDSVKDGKAVYQISAIDTRKAAAVADSVDGLSKALLDALGTQRDDILKATQAVKPFYVASHGGIDWQHRDLGELASQLKQHVKDPKVQAASDKLQAALKDAVIQQESVTEEGGVAHGMSIYLPTNGQVDPDYEQTAFAKNTGWVKFLKALKPAS